MAIALTACGGSDGASDTVPTRGPSLAPVTAPATTAFDVLAALTRIQAALGKIETGLHEAPADTSGCPLLSEALAAKASILEAPVPAAAGSLVSRALGDAQQVSDVCLQGRNGVSVITTYDEVGNAIEAIKHP